MLYPAELRARRRTIAERARDASQPVGIVNRQKRPPAPPRRPGLEGKLAADPGGVAHGEGERALCIHGVEFAGSLS